MLGRSILSVLVVGGIISCNGSASAADCRSSLALSENFKFFYLVESNLASPKAAAAARPPVSVVCTELRTGEIPATRPLMKPKTARATIVIRTDQVSAE